MHPPLRVNNSNDESEAGTSAREHGLTQAQLEEANLLNSQVESVDPSENFAKRVSIREAYQDICSQFEGESATEVKENPELIENLGKSFEHVDRSYQNVGAGGKELAADADTLLSMAKVLMSQMQSFQNSNAERTVSAASFSRALTLFLTTQPSASSPDIEGEDNPLLMEDEDFERERSSHSAASVQSHQIPTRGAVAPKISLEQWAWLGRQDLGTLSYDVSFNYQTIRPIVSEDCAPPPSKPKKERIQRAKDKKEAAVVLTNRQDQDPDDEISVAKELDKVRKSLRRAWKENPILDFYSFVIDPNDFAATVENMFYVSFLIKDGRVRLSLGETGLPVLLHVSNEEREKLHVEDRSVAETHQAIFSFSYDMWEEMVKALKERRAAGDQNSQESITSAENT